MSTSRDPSMSDRGCPWLVLVTEEPRLRSGATRSWGFSLGKSGPEPSSLCSSRASGEGHLESGARHAHRAGQGSSLHFL